MICFDVALNGSRMYRAGVGRRGVMHACVGWVHRIKGRGGPGASRRMSLILDVGGNGFSKLERKRIPCLARPPVAPW